ncbi:MAG TPA: TerC/Alx family metal homeostasis membrane protein [Streptosporangiaceae bacterium]|nr:TerC/Alx family metal homeostasis membrane protein [Streptosporangiaceae bacterium]
MSGLHVSLWVWVATVGVVILVLGAELAAGVRRGPREVRLGAAALYVAVVIGLAVLFGLVLIWLGYPAAGSQFFAGWLTEYSLSLDNLFIFVLLIGGSAVPRELHSRVLLLGVAMALVLRGSFIAVGAAAISRFGWILYFFGALLIYAAARLVVGRPDRHAPGDGVVLRTVRRLIPVSPDASTGRLITRASGRPAVTPFLLLIIAVAAADLMFALDSIPAIFGLTRDPYLIFTANAFALLGLRQLYFVIGGLLSRLVYLSAGLAVILAFIGVKLFAEALAGSGVVAVGPVPVPHISTGLSLAVIAGVLVVVTLASLLSANRAAGAAEAAGQRPVVAEERRVG